MSYYTTARAKIKVFPVCGQSCGQGRISARFVALEKSRKRLCRKAFRASALTIVDGAGSTPKAGALPTALHPVIELFYPAGRILPNNVKRFFLVIYRAFPCFLVGFWYSLGLYKPAFHRCSEAVCGHLCGQKRFPPKTGDFHQPRTGSVLCFRLSHCNSERAVMQVLSARSAAQSLRRYKQGNRGFSFPLP